MTEFAEGAQWTVYREGGFDDKYSMALSIGGVSLTGVTRFSNGFVAMNLETGCVLSHVVDLGLAVAAAEAEALSPART